MTIFGHLKECLIEVTSYCPLNCMHCSSEASPNQKELINFEKFTRLIDELHVMGVKLICLSGGEPITHPNILNMIKYIKDKGMKVHLYTCGNCINDSNSRRSNKSIPYKFLSEIKRMNLDKIIFSIHGITPKGHDYITKTGESFNNLTDSLNHSLEYKLYTEVHFVPMVPNYKNIRQIIKFLDKKAEGVKRISFLKFVPQGRGEINRTKLELSLDGLKKFFKDIPSPKERNVKIRIGNPLKPYIHKIPKCRAGKTKIIITPQGYVFPCVSVKKILKKEKDNNIFKYPINRIWKSSALFTFFRSANVEEDNVTNKCSKVVIWHPK